MCNTNDSPALRLVRLVWEHGDSKSWSRFNGALQNALRAAIEGGLEFNEGDVAHIFDKMKGFKWFVKDGHAYGEWMYRAACESGNSSARKSFEAWRGRKPFIVDGKRLYVDAWFEWHSQQVKVTSFAKDQSHLVACSYRVVKHKVSGTHGYTSHEVENIYKITHADIYAWNKERKEAADAAAKEQTNG